MVIGKVIPVVPVTVVVIVVTVIVPPILGERQVFVVAVVLPIMANLASGDKSIAILPSARPVAIVGVAAVLTIRGILAPVLVMAIDLNFVELVIVADDLVAWEIYNARVPVFAVAGFAVLQDLRTVTRRAV